MAIASKFKILLSDKSLRSSILFVLAMLAVFRLAAHIPVPGIDSSSLRDLFAGNDVLGLLNLFTGGGIENFSIVALGIGPYITSSIIFQLLVMTIPRLQELQKEGEYGQKKINQYTRLLSIPLAYLQGYGLIALLRGGGSGTASGLLGSTSFIEMASLLTILAGGTIFLMWLGELITEKNVGNGISLLIFAGIVSGIPTTLQRMFISFDQSQLVNLIIFAVIAIIVVAAIVFITEGQRNIPVSYAKRVRGNRMYGGVDTHLPLRVNQAGVIPIIFAISILLFPPVIARFFLSSGTAWLASMAQFVNDLFQNQAFFGSIYFVLVVAFTYFYTAVIFHPAQIAENLQKQGGFIPGVRPGNHTAEYIGRVSNRIMLAGALFLGLIAVLPLAMQPIFGSSILVVGGTSLLIVVAVVIEIVKQINSQIEMRTYDHL